MSPLKLVRFLCEEAEKEHRDLSLRVDDEGDTISIRASKRNGASDKSMSVKLSKTLIHAERLPQLRVSNDINRVISILEHYT